MKYIEKNNDGENIYFITYNREKLVELLDELVKKTSYRISGIFSALNGDVTSYQNGKFISCAVLPNGDSKFEDIKNVYSCSSNDKNITVEGVLVVAPELAYIIKGVLNDDMNCVKQFLDYPCHSELISIERKISIANDTVDRINNFDFDEKINALNILKRFYEMKKLNQYFSVNLLQQYYLKAQDLINLKYNSKTR